MDHPRFVEGELTTAFIAEEYPDGFNGATLPPETLRRAGGAGRASATRSPRPARRRSPARCANHARQVGARLGGAARRRRPARSTIDARRTARSDVLDDRRRDAARRAATGARAAAGARQGRRAQPLVVKVDRRRRRLPPAPPRRRPQGDGAVAAPGRARARRCRRRRRPTPRSSCSARCPASSCASTSAEGDEVYDGQALCMVEAMKMENVLRAERRGAGRQGPRPARRQPGGGRRDHGVRVTVRGVMAAREPVSCRRDGMRSIRLISSRAVGRAPGGAARRCRPCRSAPAPNPRGRSALAQRPVRGGVGVGQDHHVAVLELGQPLARACCELLHEPRVVGRVGEDRPAAAPPSAARRASAARGVGSSGLHGDGGVCARPAPARRATAPARAARASRSAGRMSPPLARKIGTSRAGCERQIRGRADGRPARESR